MLPFRGQSKCFSSYSVGETQRQKFRLNDVLYKHLAIASYYMPSKLVHFTIRNTHLSLRHALRFVEGLILWH